MKQHGSAKPEKAWDGKSDLQISAQPVLFPGEDNETYESVREAFFQDLAPQSMYERTLVDDIVHLEWEKVRHRRLRDALILAVAWAETMTALKQAYSKDEAPERAASKARADADAFVRGNAQEHQQAIKLLRAVRREPDEIMAVAYAQYGDEITRHERKLAEIEMRRRKLFRDYQDLRAAPARVIGQAGE